MAACCRVYIVSVCVELFVKLGLYSANGDEMADGRIPRLNVRMVELYEYLTGVMCFS